MAKEIIATNGAPAAIGPYSQAVRVGNLVFTAGQIPLDPATQQVVEAAGSSLDKVVKSTVFLKDFNDFAAMNEVYGAYLGSNGAAPARSTVEVSKLPRNVLVEIELIAEV